MQPRGTVASVAVMIGMAAVLAGLYAAWATLSSADTAARYRYGSGGWTQSALPLETDRAGTAQIRVDLDASGAVTRWRTRTNGCVLDATLNGERVAQDGDGCGAADLRLAGLKDGANELVVSVRTAGPLRFDLTPSPLDPLALGFSALALLELACTLLLLRRFLLLDAAGTAAAVSLLAGAALRAAMTLRSDDPSALSFLLSCAALAGLLAAVSAVRHGRGAAFPWAAGLLAAALPVLMGTLDARVELFAGALAAACVLWWSRPRVPLWILVLVLLAAGTAWEPGFLACWLPAFLLLFRRPDLPPARQLGLFLLTWAAFAAAILWARPLPALTTDLFRAAVQSTPPALPFSEPAAFFLLLPAVIGMLRLPPDGLRAARILLVSGAAASALLAWTYGGVALATTDLLLPAAVLLAADGIGKIAGRRL